MSFPLQSILLCSRKLKNHKIKVIIYNLYVFLSMSLSPPLSLSLSLFSEIHVIILYVVPNEYSDESLISNRFTQLKIQHSFKELLHQSDSKVRLLAGFSFYDGLWVIWKR